ncbi:MAG: DUF423 domain-containing protein [Flavobacteriales bacterium AspAUS03]
MKSFVLMFSAISGSLSIVLGAFGAHALKKILPDEKLLSFENGVCYQMYQTLALLTLGLFLNIQNNLEKWSLGCIMLGVFLFSGSIYILSLGGHLGWNVRFLGLVTPLGGLLIIIGWALLAIVFAKMHF